MTSKVICDILYRDDAIEMQYDVIWTRSDYDGLP